MLQLTSKEVIEKFQISHGTLSGWVKSGKVKKIKISKTEFRYEIFNDLIKYCEFCKSSIKHRTASKVCSIECKKQLQNVRAQAYWQKKIVDSKSLKGNPHALTCLECGFMTLGNLSGHLTRYHKISYNNYYKKYHVGVEAVLQQKTRLKLSESSKGEKNVWYNHGGKLSPFSKHNHRFTDNERSEIYKRSKLTMNKNENNSTRLSYYTSRGMDETKAREALLLRQQTFTLEKCILKYGENEGRKRWQERQEKWHKSYKKSNYSKISQKLFIQLKSQMPDKYILFATSNPTNKNSEFIFKTKMGSVYKLDFFYPERGRIIEFDGDYWHSIKQANPGREQKRDQEILETDEKLKILHIKEHNFQKDPTKVISQCLEFLNT